MGRRGRSEAFALALDEHEEPRGDLVGGGDEELAGGADDTAFWELIDHGGAPRLSEQGLVQDDWLRVRGSRMWGWMSNKLWRHFGDFSVNRPISGGKTAIIYLTCLGVFPARKLLRVCQRREGVTGIGP